MKLIIPGELTNLNDYIKAERGNRFAGSKIKKEETERVHWECKIQKLSLIEGSRFFVFVWYVKNKKVDPDNIVFGKKFILDGLYNAGIIYNDSQEYVKGFVDIVKIDALKPRVELTTWASLPKALKYLSTV